MSYRGRPSKGCEGCRARKIKCNEAKPTCNRCSKSGQECKYRDQADLLFRNQTAVAAQRAEESWRKRSKSQQRARNEANSSTKCTADNEVVPREVMSHPPVSGAGSNIPGHFNTTNLDDSGSSTGKERAAPTSSAGDFAIAPTVKPDLSRLAYERFIYDFVAPDMPTRPPEEPSEALFTYVPMLYQHAAPDSCLATVVHAVSYINFDNRCKAPAAAKLAEEHFGRAIKLLLRMIANKEEAASNDALCAVYLMGVYENLTSAVRRGTFAAHQTGANALLQLRTVEQFYNNPISAKLFEVAYAQMLMASLQTAKPAAIPIENLISIKTHLPGIYNNTHVAVIHLVWRETQLHAKWFEMKGRATAPASRHDLQEILQAALDLNNDYQRRENILPQRWKPQYGPNRREIRPVYGPIWQKLVLESRGAPEKIHSFFSLKRCYIWSLFRTSRMFLLRDILEILNWMFRMPEPSPNSSTLHLRTDSTQHFTTTTLQQAITTNKITSLDGLTLRNYHTIIATRIVDLIENGCAAVLGSFTVPVYRKSTTDVMSIRGYILFWALGTMDSILKSGLVPDSHAPVPHAHASSAFTPHTQPYPGSTHQLSTQTRYTPPLTQTRYTPPLTQPSSSKTTPPPQPQPQPQPQPHFPPLPPPPPPPPPAPHPPIHPYLRPPLHPHQIPQRHPHRPHTAPAPCPTAQNNRRGRETGVDQ
ncbi:hypothetical protein GQ44DRAFT_823590 [Phaeosphaeriaceae sp. PMI808]|nr:hypothetical protein GQ44DRAFT_823590 [Phaeosphaeriaceae sp. PMI808]